VPVTLKLDHPDFPDDMEFGISSLGRVKNHGTLEVDDDAVARFEASSGMSIADAFKGNAVVTISGQQEQPQQQEPTAPAEPIASSVVPAP
jgi:hypothetical protein